MKKSYNNNKWGEKFWDVLCLRNYILSIYSYLRGTHLNLREIHVFRQHAVPENSRDKRLKRARTLRKKYAYDRNKYHYRDIIWPDENLFKVKETRNNKGKNIIVLEE